MPQSYDFIFKPARDFSEKFLKKFGPHVLSGKNLRHLRYLRGNEQVTQMTQIRRYLRHMKLHGDSQERVYMQR